MSEWRNGDWLFAKRTNHHYAWVRTSEVASVESDPITDTDGELITRTYITMKGGNVVVDTEHDAYEWMEAIQGSTPTSLGFHLAQFHAKDVEQVEGRLNHDRPHPKGPSNKDVKIR